MVSDSPAEEVLACPHKKLKAAPYHVLWHGRAHKNLRNSSEKLS
jgi:hypothetical protein